MTSPDILNSQLAVIKLDAKLSELKNRVGLVIQSLLFPQGKYDQDSAKKWAAEKGYKTNKLDIPQEGKFIHLIQKIGSRFNAYKTISVGDEVKARIAGYNVSKFAGHVMMKGFSKFSDDVKSELDLKIPMEVELKVLCDGVNRDGIIKREGLEEAVASWDIPIIDWHNLKDMKHPTDHKITDRKGYGTTDARIELIDGKYWTIVNGCITDRYLAYLIYLADKQDKPYEISPEYGWTPFWVGGEKVQANINPHLITIVDKGHIEGNKLTIKSAS